MLEILVISIVLLIGLAKRGRSSGRKMGRYIKGGVNETLSLGTLAATTLVGVDFDEAVNERTLVSSIVATWALSDTTIAANRGPVLVGVAHSDYTDAEIEAVIELTDSWDEGNKTQQEIAKRLVRKIGTLTADGQIAVLNDGRPIKTKLNWILNQGQTLRLWAYNTGTAALDAGAVRIEGHANLWPK